MKKLAPLLFMLAAISTLYSQVDTLVAKDMKRVYYADSTYAVYPDYYHRAVNPQGEGGRSVTFEIVSQPEHGTVAVSQYGYSFDYTPSAGFTGKDEFTWRFSANDTASNIAKCRILVRSINGQAGELVIIIVNNKLYSPLLPEITRLATDLESEGYATKLTSWVPDSARRVWDYLKAEYDSVNQFLAGAILIGNIPIPTVTSGTTTTKTDLVYWNMSVYGNAYSRHIWVSRIWANNKWGTGSVWGGSDTAMIKRYLQANHDYRTGLSRYSHLAYHYNDVVDAYGGKIENALEVWPAVKTPVHVIYAFRDGGDIIHETAHGNAGAYDYYGSYPRVSVTTTRIYDYLAQARFVLNTSCTSGEPGGVVNNQLFTRRGGNILSVGLSATGYTGALIILDSNTTDKNFRSQLARGNTWGASIVNVYPFMDYQRPIFYGDLSLPVKLFPHNAMPIVDTLIADVRIGNAPLTVNFTPTARDSDGTITTYEWFPAGHYYGKNEPIYSVTDPSTQQYTYTLPHRYMARVQAIDNYQAVAWKEVEIIVGPQPNVPLRVNCGYRSFEAEDYNSMYRPNDDLLDKDGALWLHDQGYIAGTWGFASASYGSSSSAVQGTEEDSLFKWYRYCQDSRTPVLIYKIPLVNGPYTLKLGFADMQSTAAGQRIMDIVVEGDTIESDLDVYAVAGAKTAHIVTANINVDDGEMEIRISKDTLGTHYPFLNCFEVLPANVSNESRLLAASYLSIYPNPFGAVTSVRFNLLQRAEADIRVYDINGRLVNILSTGLKNVGNYSVAWHGTDQSNKKVAGGIYYIRTEIQGKKQLRKVILLK